MKEKLSTRELKIQLYDTKAKLAETKKLLDEALALAERKICAHVWTPVAVDNTELRDPDADDDRGVFVHEHGTEIEFYCQGGELEGTFFLPSGFAICQIDSAAYTSAKPAPNYEQTLEDLTCGLAIVQAEVVGLRQSITLWEQTAQANQLFQPWQPITTETEFTGKFAGPKLFVEDTGDIISLETNGIGPSFLLPDDVRLCRMEKT